MAYMHGFGVLHRDLKLENILYDEDGPRIVDLGWSKAVRRGQANTAKRGTEAYAAPEVLEEYGDYGLWADVYSYGICLWELMTGRIWSQELPARCAGSSVYDQVVRFGLRPPIDRLRPEAQELLMKCFGADTKPENRCSFAEIVALFEKQPTVYFERADLRKFEEYREYLDRAGAELLDENLMYLLRQLTDMMHIGEQLEQLPKGSPFVDKTLFCLGRLFGDDKNQNEDVVLVARYQFATKRFLDGAAFLNALDAIEALNTLENIRAVESRELFEALGALRAITPPEVAEGLEGISPPEALQTLKQRLAAEALRSLHTSRPDRVTFPLAKFLINPEAPAGPNRVLTRIPILNRDALFRALRNILAGICCEHPCVTKFHGWNIAYDQGQCEIVMVTEVGTPFSIAEFEGWDVQRQAAFLLTVAVGIFEMHCRGVFHNNLQSVTSLQVSDGRAQICDFGLLDDSASYLTDTKACQELFAHAADEAFRLRRSIKNQEGEISEVELSIEGYVEEVLEHEKEVEKGTAASWPLRNMYERIQKEAKTHTFPFELYLHLVRSKEVWASSDGPCDVGDALAQLTLGLDTDAKERFKTAVNEAISARGFLALDFFARF
jgi:serine/threonine protein kinase